MDTKTPRITFLLPYRLLTADRDFLGANLVKRVQDFLGDGDEQVLRAVTVYQVVMNLQGYRPVPVSVSARELTRLLKPVFPNGKCLGSESLFVQTKSKTMLPVLDVQIFF